KRSCLRETCDVPSFPVRASLVPTVLAVFVLAGCTASTRGAPGSASAKPGSTHLAAPSPTATPGLRCPAGSEHPTGAPFCYLVPAGFSDDSGAKFIGHGWKYRTMVFVS